MMNDFVTVPDDRGKALRINLKCVEVVGQNEEGYAEVRFVSGIKNTLGIRNETFIKFVRNREQAEQKEAQHPVLVRTTREFAG